MTYFRKLLVIVISAVAALPQGRAIEVVIEEPKPKPVIGTLLRPFHFEKRYVTPARLTNTPRLESLVRGGNLYLSVQDVIALVLENNLDIAIQRYGPFLAREVLRRAEGGGFLRSIDTPIAPGPVSVSLAGVSVNTAGLAAGATVGSGGGIVTQIGPTPPNLDPYIIAFASFAHTTTPLSNTILSQTTALTDDIQQYQLGYGKQFLTGTSTQLSFYSARSLVNSPANLLNPATQGFLDFYVTQNLLQGFRIAVNNRNIRVARNNMKVTDLQLKLQVITTLSAVLGVYWDLVSFNEDVRIKEQTLTAAEKFYEDNKKRVSAGALSAIELTRNAAQVSANKEDLLISQTNVAQQETVLKNALSRNGVASPWLDDVHIVTLDRIHVPEKEDVKPPAELISEALLQRPELERARTNLQSLLINVAGTRNALLPTLQAFADFSSNALSGDVNALASGSSGVPYPGFIGGYGSLFGQIFRRNYPNYSVGFSLNIPFRNRIAQADYVSDQLALRQGQLQLQRSINQVRVDVKIAVIGLQQARARYETAVATRVLAQQTLDAEQKRFQFGQSTIPLLVQAQRDLAQDQSAEVQATANYTHAKVAFDEAVGQTLDVNGISIEEARSGHVAWQSSIPDLGPGQKGSRQK